MTLMKTVKLIPFVCGAGASAAGAEQGPVDLYKFGLDDYLRGIGIDASWCENPLELYKSEKGEAAHKNLPPLGSAEREELVLWHCRHFREQVEAVINEGAMPVTLGGDHSMGAASIAALARAKNAHGRIGVLWIDAHADINTPETSYSKALHGMPVAALLGMGDKEFASLGGDIPALKPEHICYIGLRDVDPGETDYMKEMGISAFYMKDIAEKGLPEVIREAMEVITSNTDHLFVSIDIDGLDPQDASATGSPVKDGIRKKDLLPVLSDIAVKYNFDGFEIAEYNPTLGDADTTKKTICDLLQAFLSAEEAIELEEVG